MSKRTPWFREGKTYGWWPVTWQGWTVFFIWVAVFAGFIAWANLRFTNVWLAMAVSILFGGFWLGVLWGICTRTGQAERQHRSSRREEQA